MWCLRITHRGLSENYRKKSGVFFLTGHLALPDDVILFRSVGRISSKWLT